MGLVAASAQMRAIAEDLARLSAARAELFPEKKSG